MIYLASPYSHPNPLMRIARFNAVARAAARLMAEGKEVFCPITHSHPIQAMGDLPAGWEYWKRIDQWALEHCDEVYILALPGWDTSEGVRAEVAFADDHGMRITFLQPTNLEMSEVNPAVILGDNPQPTGEADIDG